MLKFLPDHFKTQKMQHVACMCKHAVKKLPFLLRYNPNQQMCDKAILKNGGH